MHSETVERQLEVAQLWRGTLLELRRFDPQHDVTIGHGSRADFAVDQPEIGARSTLLRGADLSLAPGDVATLPIGPLTFEVRWAPKVTRARVELGQLDFRFPKVLVILALCVAGLLLALRESADSRELGHDELQRNPLVIHRVLPVPEKPILTALPAASAPAPKPAGAASPVRRPEAHADRASTRASVAHVGMLDAINHLNGAQSIFEAGGPSSELNAALQGVHSGSSTIGDSHGVSGLATRGTGPGGGGPDNSLGIGGPGTKDGRGTKDGDALLADGVHRHVRISSEPVRVVGALSRDEIERVIKRHQSEILFCYNTELQKDPSLAGKVAVTFTIGGAGAVADAQVQQSTLGNSAVESCVLARIGRWRFPEPKGGGVVVVTYPWIFAQAGGE